MNQKINIRKEVNKMKKAKKILALLLCAVLLIGASVAGTLAYLTFQTNEVKNTFSVGKVNLGDQYNSGLVNARNDTLAIHRLI